MRIFLAIFAAILLAGCGIARKEIILNMPAAGKDFRALKLPDAVSFDGKFFNEKIQNVESVEYRLDSEKELDWSEIVSVAYCPNFKSIDEYVSAVKNANEKQNAKGKRLSQIVEISPEVSYQKTLYYPTSEFDFYEVDFVVSSVKKCGLIGIFYAKKFSKSNSDKNLIKFLKNYDFLVKAPKIECK